MDFDLDDPLLDDILKSDISADSSIGIKNTPKKAIPKNEQKSKLTNLFGIKSEVVETTMSKVIETPKKAVPSKPTTPKLEISSVPQKKKEVSFDEDDDIDLGFDPKNSKQKTNFFDDLLGSPPTSSKGAENKKKEAIPIPMSSFTKIVSEKETTPQKRPKTAIYQPPTRDKSQLNDPLGLFKSSKPIENPQKEPNFDWLGLQPSDSEKSKASSRKNSVKEAEKPEVVAEANYKPLVVSDNNESILLQALKQQESQLVIADQMKKQEHILIDMQRRQHELIKQQEAKFNSLLQSQIQRQSVLEDTIQSQQSRINSHIQKLMNQPTTLVEFEENQTPLTPESPKNRDEEMIELQNDVKRLELEKLRLDDLHSNASSMHEQEMKILEDGFRKMETRLLKDNHDLEQFYQQKTTILQSENNDIVRKYEEKIKTLINDHQLSLENIRQSKLFEFTLVQENTSYLNQLKAASNNLETATGNIENLRETITNQIEMHQLEKERELSTRTKKLDSDEKRLEISLESSQVEQRRLLELVQTLETRIRELTKETSEEQWNMRQKLAILESERSAFEKEQKYYRDQQLRDEKRIEDLKESVLKEQQIVSEEIQAERLKITEEKVKLETLKKLNESQRPNKSILENEVNIAIKVAKEAAHQSDLEREALMGIQRQFELKKREMIDYENRIRRKEAELEMVLQVAKQREHKAEEIIRHLKAMEQKILIKYQQLSVNVQDFVQREKKLNSEQQILSKERLELQNLRKQMNDKNASNSKLAQLQDNIENFNYNDLNSTFNTTNGGIDGMFEQELNEILKNIPPSTDTFTNLDIYSFNINNLADYNYKQGN